MEMSILKIFLLFFLAGCVSSASLFPYGVSAGDSELPPNDDGSIGPLNFTYGFIFYGTTYTTFYVNTNGVISFIAPVHAYNPQPFPLDNSPLISPFWANVDIRLPDGYVPGSPRGHVWYRATSDISTVLSVREEVIQYFSNDQDFVPNEILIATWDNVGYYNKKTDKTNTFQCVLATNGVTSYAMFLFPEGGINWYSGDASGGTGGINGTPAQVGLNKGDGVTYHVLNVSSTPDVINVEDYTNITGAPNGFYIWNVNDGTSGSSCDTTNNDITVLISPNSGNELGGTPVTVKGPCFNATDNITCLFGDASVPGAIVSINTALCVSPLLNTTVTSVEFVLRSNGSNVGSTAIFYFNSFSDLADVRMVTDDNNITVNAGDSITLQWTNSSLLPLVNESHYDIDIEFYWLDIKFGIIPNPTDMDNAVLSSSSTDATGLANDGSVNVIVPSISGNNFPFVPVFFKVTVNVSSSSSSNQYISALKALYSDGTSNRVGIWSHVIVWKNRDDCPGFINTWVPSTLQPPPTCPCNINQANLPGSGFEPDVSPGRRIMDQYLHPTASLCYRSTGFFNVTSSFISRNSTAKQQCCYNSNGSLILGRYGGHELRNIPENQPAVLSYANEFTDNIVPFIRYCLLTGCDCSTFESYRPSSNCSGFSVQPSSFMYGDPHLLTLDGLQYTFNGRGEFILIQTVNNLLTVQGRMVPISNTNSAPANGTVFSSIVAKESTSDTVEFQYSFIGLRAIVNGAWVIIDTGLPVHYNNVTIRNNGNNTYTAVFSDGVNIIVKQEHDYLSLVSVSLPDTYRHITSGLLGRFDGNSNNDLEPRYGELPRDPTNQQIHYFFGMTWIINSSSNSLFTYDSTHNFNNYYDPDFIPAFSPQFNDTALESMATALCGTNAACLFDIAVTGRIDIGMSTIQQVETIEEIKINSQPIVCDPPCMRGACVNTDTCSCPYGYNGPLCQNIITFECGPGNPCQNNASCYRQLYTSYCTCEPPYTGTYCETADCEAPEEAVHPLLVTYNGTLTGSVAVYTCTDGYALAGNDTTSYCDEDGEWTDIDAECIVDCGNLSTNSLQLIVSYSSTLLHSVAQYSCAQPESYQLIGDSQRVCTDNGQWSNDPPYCQMIIHPVDCGSPPSVHNVPYLTVTTSSGTLEGSIATYSCTNGRILQGNTNSVCLSSGMWSNVEQRRCLNDCGVPHINDTCLRYNVSATTEGSVLKYFCLTPQCRLDGNEVSTCLSNGSWSGLRPSCIKLEDCGPPPLLNYGLSVTYNHTYAGSVATYYCQESNAELIGDNVTALCTDDGEWEGDQPVCTEPVNDNAGIYIAVGTTLGVLLVALIIGILIGTVVIFSFNRFKATFNVQKEHLELSEI
ncbi:PREDICTED: protein mesh-like isoform X3 [Amphimedon queenslandica]|uniref:Sushi, nidogen and EGF-like domain-containing protein 1 n=1 Tax=Amphimedon queenslandica TaxID=400682 RepID=A0A1X7UEE9_AMPQE|nr:PREDICTED: protein mesh-like isoform X3 [Amphimedon queenslandica]|eukprot:XP_019854776.1 PREDICTED: protein mesh-like isoform X3 [Amphimedon queenslandica]